MDFSPVPLNLFLNVQFLNPQILSDFNRPAVVLIEKIGVQIKYISQAVGDVQRHDDGTLPFFSGPDTGGSRYGSLADTAFSCKKYDSRHKYLFILSLILVHFGRLSENWLCCKYRPWKGGIMECWNIGYDGLSSNYIKAELTQSYNNKANIRFFSPPFHLSTIPLFH